MNIRAGYTHGDVDVKHEGADMSERALEQLGMTLRKHRRMHGNWPIAKMADRLAVSERALSNYELGHRLPDIDFLARFSRCTGAPLYELIALRLEAAGETGFGRVLRDSGSGQYQAGSDAAAHARQSLLAARGLDHAWSLLVMEMAARGEITPDGIDRMLEFLSDWTMDDDRAWEWIEAHAKEVVEWANQPDY